jgi:3'(2'), 5'-bisphosphate nucleotidase
LKWIHTAKTIDNLHELCLEVNNLIMKIYQKDFQIETKSDESPVTEADLAANLLIISSLQKMFPKIPIISEETSKTHYDIRKNYEYVWIIDPIDGTKEFIAKNGEFAVNIGLIHNRRPILSFVSLPAFEEIYFAIKGEGSNKSKNGKSSPIFANKVNMEAAGLKIGVSRSHTNGLTTEWIEQLDNPEWVQMGSAMKFLKVADGTLDLYPKVGNTCDWDIAAPDLIVTEAGGEMRSILTDKIINYNTETLIIDGFLASGKIEK